MFIVKMNLFCGCIGIHNTYISPPVTSLISSLFLSPPPPPPPPPPLAPSMFSNIMRMSVRRHFLFSTNKGKQLKVIEEMAESAFNIQVPIELL